MIRISLIVPTFNRASYLYESLPSFLDQTLDPAAYEIIVVDNNSTDNTREVAEKLLSAAKCQQKCIFEPKQGLHHARNRGIREAQGDIVVFGDDDIVAGRSWLENLLSEFDRGSDIGIVGGKITPVWDEPPPRWIYDYGTELVHGVFAYLDYGDERLVLEQGWLFGCNFAIRRDIALAIGGSYPDTFPRSLRHLSGSGEIAMIDGARRMGLKVVYLPSAHVQHHAAAARATLQYFIDRHERWAVEVVFESVRKKGRARAFFPLVIASFRRLVSSLLVCRHKMKPGYCVAIETAAALQMFRQAVRVLCDNSLYAHIKRESYL